MADFTVGMTKAATMDDSQVLLFWQGVLFAAQPYLVATQVATMKETIGAKSIQFSKIGDITVDTTALTDGVDPDSTALSDTQVTLTPAEHGKVVTTTRLGSLQTGGKLDKAAVQSIGIHMGKHLDKQAVEALDAFGGTILYPNTATAASNLATTDVLDKLFAGRLFNKLNRAAIPGIAGTYYGIAHDDALHDLREDAGAGSWTDVSKYSNLTPVLNGEVGLYKGIRWLNTGNATVTADSNGTIDSYKINVCGMNALGYAVSEAPGLRITGPFDKLGRFINVGWYGVVHYDTIQAANQVQGICASSVGDN